MAIKQIEVNGTTYDIGLPGSDLPVLCETFDVSSSFELGYLTSILEDKHSEENYTYEYLEDYHILLRKVERNGETIDDAIVIARPVPVD